MHLPDPLLKHMYESERLDFCFAFLVTRIRFRNVKGFTDINRYVENFFLPLASQVFDTQLKWTNQDKSNYEFIDLRDEDNSVIVQVTTNRKKEKLLECIRGCREHYPHARLYYLLLSEDIPLYNKETLDQMEEHDSYFDPGRQLLSLGKFTNMVMELPDDRRKVVMRLVENSAGSFRNDYQQETRDSSYTQLNDLFWKYAASFSCDDYLVGLNSHPAIICSAIQRGLAVNQKTQITGHGTDTVWSVFSNLLEGGYHTNLVEVIGEPGAGKSTLLFQLAYHYRSQFDIFLVQRPEAWELLAGMKFEKPVLILLNEIEPLENNWKEVPGLISAAAANGCIVCVAERIDKWNQWEEKGELKKMFHFVHRVRLVNGMRQVSNVVRKLQKITGSTFQYTIQLQQNWAIADYIIDYLDKCGSDFSHIIKPDWKTWEERFREEPIASLYDRVAFLNYYGIILPEETCYTYFNINYAALSRIVVDKERGLLTIQNGGLMLRHLKLAQWYFKCYPQKLSLLLGEMKHRIKHPVLCDLTVIRKLFGVTAFQQDTGFSIPEIIAALERFKSLPGIDAEEYSKNSCEMAKFYFWQLKQPDKAYAILEEIKSKGSLPVIALEYKFKLGQPDWMDHREELERVCAENPGDVHLQKLRKEFRLKAYETNHVSVLALAEEYMRGQTSLDLCLDFMFRYRKVPNPIEVVSREFRQFCSLVGQESAFIQELADLSPRYPRHQHIIFDIIGTNLAAAGSEIRSAVFFYRCQVSDFWNAFTFLEETPPGPEAFGYLKYFLSKAMTWKKLYSNNSLLDRIIRYIIRLEADASTPAGIKPYFFKYLEALYKKYNDFEKQEEFTRLLEQGVQKYPENNFLKYQMARYYMWGYDFSDVEEKVLKLMQSVPEEDREHPEYLMTATRIAYNKEDHEEASRLMKQLAEKKDYYKSAFFIRINSLYYSRRHKEVVSAIADDLYSAENFADSTANEMFLRSFILACQNTDDLTRMYHQHRRHLERLQELNVGEARIAELAALLFETKSGQDNELFRARLEEMKSLCRLEYIQYMLLLIKFIAAAGRYYVLKELLTHLRVTPKLQKYFDFNKLLLFFDFVAKLVNFNIIRIKPKGSGREVSLRPHGRLENNFNINLIARYSAALKDAGYIRRAYLLVYIHWLYSLQGHKKKMLKGILEQEAHLLSSDYPEIISTVEYRGDNQFVYLHNGEEHFFEDKKLAAKVHPGWKTDKSYINYNNRTGKVTGSERFFTIETERAAGLTFYTWLPKALLVY